MSHVQSACFQPLSAQLQGSGHGDRAVQRALRDGVADALDLEARGRGVHGLAVAIREKFAAANAGPEAVSSVLETIDRALDDVAGKLAAQGVSQEQIDAGIERFRNKLAREIGELAGSSPAPSTTLEKSAIAAREVVRERFSLDVLTAEGDKVSIRFKTLNVTEVAAAQVSDGTNTATAVEGSVISRGRFKVEVNGDLNDAERAAIGDLLDKVDDIAADFFGGDVQEAFAAAGRVSLDASALSAFDLKLSYSRSVAAVKTYASTAQLGSAPVAQPAPAPAIPPAASAPAVTPASSTSPATSDPVTLPAVTAAAAEVKPAPNEAATPPAVEGTPTSTAVAQNTAKMSSALQTITSFAKDVLERLDEAGDSKAPKFSLRWKVEFLVKAFGSVALTPVEQKAADALGIALDGRSPA